MHRRPRIGGDCRVAATRPIGGRQCRTDGKHSQRQGNGSFLGAPTSSSSSASEIWISASASSSARRAQDLSLGLNEGIEVDPTIRTRPWPHRSWRAPAQQRAAQQARLVDIGFEGGVHLTQLAIEPRFGGGYLAARGIDVARPPAPVPGGNFAAAGY